MGIASTIAYVLLYLLLRGVMSAQAANAASLLVTAVANTAANRRLTFGISGRLHAARHQVKGLIAFGIGLVLTSGALAALPAIPVAASRSRSSSPPTWWPPSSDSCCTGPGSSASPGQINLTLIRESQLSATTSVARHSTRTRPRPTRNRARRLLRGPDTDPRWARPALLGLLALTALLYLWDLTRNGWANDFYAAAVQAGTKSWKAFFFGSFDSSNFITVDKTPASLWVMELSGRIFGFSQWSMLVPQALEGVASVGLLYAAVRRWFGPPAGLVAGLVLALTPVAALMFRFNNPDALLVLLMTAAAYALVRAIENGRTRWLVFCGVLLGFAFLAKMLQAFLVVPGFAIAYLWAGAPRAWPRRLWQTAAMGAGIIVGAGWWILIAELTPAADRPYFGGSTDNNILQLAIGYNGLGRLDGNETGSIGGGGAQGSGFGGATGLLRLFHSEFGGQISWLLPAALICLAAMAVGVAAGGAHRPDPGRGPAVGRLGDRHRAGVQLHERHHPPVLHGRAGARHRRAGRHRRDVRCGSSGWAGPGVRWRPRRCWSRRCGRTSCWTGRRTGCRGCAGWCWSRACCRRARCWRVPGWPGRARSGGWCCCRWGWPWWRGWPGRPLTRWIRSTPRTPARSRARGRLRWGSVAAPGGGGGFAGARPGGTRPRRDRGPTGSRAGSSAGPVGSEWHGGSGGRVRAARVGGSGRHGSAVWAARVAVWAARAVTGGPGGGLGGNTQVSSALVKLLEQDASSYKWVAATEGSEEAAPLELATGDAVMAIGGFNGTDPWPTLAVFKELVAKHEMHYYVGQGSESFGGGRGSSAIASWVAAHFKKETVGGQTVYDLTQPLSGTA